CGPERQVHHSRNHPSLWLQCDPLSVISPVAHQANKSLINSWRDRWQRSHQWWATAKYLTDASQILALDPCRRARSPPLPFGLAVGLVRSQLTSRTFSDWTYSESVRFDRVCFR